MTVLGTLLIAVGTCCLGAGAALLVQRALRRRQEDDDAFSAPGYSVEVDCRECGQYNRVQADRLRDRPRCGRCKRRLLPGRRLVLCRVSQLESALCAEVNAVWADEDRLWL